MKRFTQWMEDNGYDAGDVALAAGEMALSGASGALAWPLSVGAGLGQLQREPMEPGVARAYGRQVADRFTYEPRSELAQRGLQAAGEALSPLLEPILSEAHT